MLNLRKGFFTKKTKKKTNFFARCEDVKVEQKLNLNFKTVEF